MTEQSQQIALYQGVNVEKAAYMAAFSQPQLPVPPTSKTSAA